MNDLDPRERLLRVLGRQPVDRPPVLCPGGMMNAAIVEIVESAGSLLPAAHADSSQMAELATVVQRLTGFENLGAPFCLTVEAEALGSEVDYGSVSCEPKIRAEAFADLREVPIRPVSELLAGGRIGAVAEAVSRLNARHADIPVIGNVSGPISTAASLVEPTVFYKGLRKHREAAHRLLGYVTDFLIEYARILCDSGASVITIGDPSATGEILGPRLFAEFAVLYLNRLADGIRATGTPAIVHICGDIAPVREQIPLLACDAISTDAMVDLPALKRDFPGLITMGNLSTFLLQFGDPERVEARTARLLRDGVDIISPACGLSTSTALDNIRALTETVKTAGRPASIRDGVGRSSARFAESSAPVRSYAVRFQPSGKSAVANEGDTLIAVARRAGLAVHAPCGGEGTCGKCVVRLPPAAADRVKVVDNAALSAAEIREGLVLACQTQVAGDVEAFVPEADAGADLRILTDGYAGERRVAPHVRKHYQAEADVTLVSAGGDVIGRERGDTAREAYAVAVDIGTTTLVASLLDLSRGAVLATESSLNPQALHVQDVLSRIKTASTDEGLAFLHGMLRDEINALLVRLVIAAKARLRRVYEVAFSGNTCMLHLAVGAPTAALGKYPYTPSVRGGHSLPAADIGLRIARFGQIYLPPIIGPYVGADIASGILVTELAQRSGVILFIDIGTNGEIVLADHGRLLATSTAAGPAFEGMNIRHGMRAAPGAVERFQIEPDLSVRIDTIGNQPATGICGSGLIDLVAELVRVGVVASNGRLAKPGTLGSSALAPHLLLVDGKPAFRVTENLCLTQSDIRHVQLAKGALRAGVEMLLKHAGREAAQVDEVLIAGSFGYHLRADSLARLGLLPPALRDRVRFVGNTSRTGAEALLLNADNRRHLRELVARIQVIELADDGEFQKAFMKSMAFGQAEGSSTSCDPDGTHRVQQRGE